MDKKIISIIIVVVLVVGGGCFYAGMQYGKSQSATSSAGRNFANLAPGQRPGSSGAGGQEMRNGGGFTVGEILSKDDKSVTIKLSDGGSKIVFFTATTSVTKSAEGAIGDLNVGGQVTVTGTANQDGSISAQSIQIRPEVPPTPKS